jgi:heat shock protein HtpX
MAQIPQKDLREVSAASALCIAPALKGSDVKSFFSTHPPLEKRLAQLAKIQAELGRPAL